MTAFLNDIKRAAVEAVRASKPFAFTLGEVVSASPLKVRVDQKLTLAGSQLVLTNAVRDHTVRLSDVTAASDEALAYHVHLRLAVGERVLMLRTDGGQKYIILDRVEAPA